MRVEHLPTEHRFMARLAEGDAVLNYRLVANAVMDIQSTYVPDAARGRGVGGMLVEHALEYARVEGYRVRPTCWYVETWVGQHPEFAGLMEEGPTPR